MTTHARRGGTMDLDDEALGAVIARERQRLDAEETERAAEAEAEAAEVQRLIDLGEVGAGVNELADAVRSQAGNWPRRPPPLPPPRKGSARRSRTITAW